MVIKCRICGGKGSIKLGVFDGDTVCPTCRGAGELDLQIPKERLTNCRFCAGRGVIQQSFFDIAGVCPTCKGLGVLERPAVGLDSTPPRAAKPPASRRPTKVHYDVAISYAGEDADVVRPYADVLAKNKVRLFYADFEQVDLWGVDLYETLDRIYRLEAKYCVIFLSKHYAAKVWTNHERRAAQARAVQENGEYILPVRLDRTEIPGLRPTIGYLDFQKLGVKGLVDATLRKLGLINNRK